MQQGQRHIIQKQVLEVEMENPADAFQFRNRLGEVMNDHILPKMEQLFNDFTASGQVYRIDKLEIDIGTISLENWEEELTNKTIAQIRQSLQLQSPLWVDERANAKAATANQNSFPAKAVANKTESHIEAHNQEIFFYYLSHGSIPWHASANVDLKTYVSNVFKNEVFINSLRQFLLTAPPVAIKRLVYLLPTQLLYKILKTLMPPGHSSYWQTIYAASKILLKRIGISEAVIAGREFYISWFQWFSHANNQQDVLQFVAKETAITLADLIQRKLARSPTFTKQELSNKFIRLLHTIMLKQNDKAGNILPLQEDQLVKPSLTETKDVLPNDELFVENAGLVLLHPFIAGFFEEVKLTDKNIFVNEIAHIKVVALTNYLLTGQTDLQDHTLMLNKILCGFPLHEPIPADLQLLQTEMDEADNLMQQVIALWKQNNVQVNSTVEGFRQSFLLRRGKLTVDAKNWHLQVEQKPYDMLMSSLPWGVSLIKTPWMEGLLWVDWA